MSVFNIEAMNEILAVIDIFYIETMAILFLFKVL